MTDDELVAAAVTARYKHRLNTTTEIPDLWLVICHALDWEDCLGYHIDTIHTTEQSAQQRRDQLNQQLEPYEAETIRGNKYEVQKLEITEDEPQYAGWRTYDQVETLGKCYKCLTGDTHRHKGQRCKHCKEHCPIYQNCNHIFEINEYPYYVLDRHQRVAAHSTTLVTECSQCRMKDAND